MPEEMDASLTVQLATGKRIDQPAPEAEAPVRTPGVPVGPSSPLQAEPCADDLGEYDACHPDRDPPGVTPGEHVLQLLQWVSFLVIRVYWTRQEHPSRRGVLPLVQHG